MENKSKLKKMIVAQNVKLHKYCNSEWWTYNYSDQLK